MAVDSGESMNKVFYFMEHLFSVISLKPRLINLTQSRKAAKEDNANFPFYIEHISFTFLLL